MNRTTYQIVTRHPTGYKDGTHAVDVCINSNGTRYVSGGLVGCSRDYAVAKDVDAIRMQLSEHSMTLVGNPKRLK